MVIIGSRFGPIEGGGATLIVRLTEGLKNHLGSLGSTAKWSFQIGAWSAIFSSLPGVWQSVPYLFADFWQLRKIQWQSDTRFSVSTTSRPYNAYLLTIVIRWCIAIITTARARPIV